MPKFGRKIKTATTVATEIESEILVAAAGAATAMNIRQGKQYRKS